MTQKLDNSFTEMDSSLKNQDLKKFLFHFVPLSEFDQHSFRNLYQDTSEETVIKMLAHFQVNLFDTSEQLQIGMNTENIDVIWKAMHKMAGTSELLGFKNFAVESRTLSKQVRASGSVESLREEIRQYRDKTIKLYRDIETTFPTLQAYL
jgi:HPt (histidine-containing phosphotransfer) domain-containing protein